MFWYMYIGILVYQVGIHLKISIVHWVGLNNVRAELQKPLSASAMLTGKFLRIRAKQGHFDPPVGDVTFLHHRRSF